MKGKRLTVNETINRLTNGDSSLSIVSDSSPRVTSIVGNIHIGVSKGRSEQYFLPRYLSLFGDFTYDSSKSNLSYCLATAPASLSATGNVLFRTKDRLRDEKNGTLSIYADGDIELDHLKNDQLMTFRLLATKGSLIIRNYYGEEITRYTAEKWMFAKVKLINCPNLKSVANCIADQVEVVNCPKLLCGKDVVVEDMIACKGDKLTNSQEKHLKVRKELTINENSLSVLPRKITANDLRIYGSDLSNLGSISFEGEPSKTTLILNECKTNGGKLPEISVAEGITLEEVSLKKTDVETLDELDILNNVKFLNVSDCPLTELPKGLRLQKLNIIGTNIAEIPNVFDFDTDWFNFSLSFDVDKIKNAVVKTYSTGNGDDLKSLALIRCGYEVLVICQHNTTNRKVLFKLDDYRKEIASKECYAGSDEPYYREEHAEYLRAQLKMGLEMLRLKMSMA